jgi:hypothetical protein
MINLFVLWYAVFKHIFKLSNRKHFKNRDSISTKFLCKRLFVLIIIIRFCVFYVTCFITNNSNISFAIRVNTVYRCRLCLAFLRRSLRFWFRRRLGLCRGSRLNLGLACNIIFSCLYQNINELVKSFSVLWYYPGYNALGILNPSDKLVIKAFVLNADLRIELIP